MQKQMPKFHETFIPILKVLEDGNTVTLKELKTKVKEAFFSDLSKELLNQRTETGGILLYNRIGWGKAYLKQAELIWQPERAVIQITEKGKKILEKGNLTLSELKKDSDFIKNKHENKFKEESTSETIETDASPDDMLKNGFDIIESQLKVDLMERLRVMDPYLFEQVILKLFKKMGYGDFVGTPKTNDGGIDGIIKQDTLGIEKIYTQAKRYAEGNNIQRVEVDRFIGAISDVDKGIFVTTSDFSKSAREKASSSHKYKIILINGEELVDLMVKYNIGVQTKVLYEIKIIDSDFFDQE